MDDALRALLTLAFEEVPAVEATARLAAARARLGGAAQVRSYEVVLGSEADFDGFSRGVVPKLVYHFESLGIRPPQGAGAFVSFFAGDRLHLVHLADVFGFVCERMGLSADELLQRFGTGERREPVALLGPGQRG